MKLIKKTTKTSIIFLIAIIMFCLNFFVLNFDKKLFNDPLKQNNDIVSVNNKNVNVTNSFSIQFDIPHQTGYRKVEETIKIDKTSEYYEYIFLDLLVLGNNNEAKVDIQGGKSVYGSKKLIISNLEEGYVQLVFVLVYRPYKEDKVYFDPFTDEDQFINIKHKMSPASKASAITVPIVVIVLATISGVYYFNKKKQTKMYKD